MKVKTESVANGEGLNSCLAEFLDYLICEKGLSLKTQSAYRSDLEIFRAFLGNGGSGVAWNEVTTRSVLAFLDNRKSAGIGGSTLARSLSSIRCFFRFLAAEKVVASDPTAELRRPAGKRPLPHPLSRTETLRLLEAPDVETPVGLRDRAVLELIYAAGLRVSEACALRGENIARSFRLCQGSITFQDIP